MPRSAHRGAGARGWRATGVYVRLATAAYGPRLWALRAPSGDCVYLLQSPKGFALTTACRSQVNEPSRLSRRAADRLHQRGARDRLIPTRRRRWSIGRVRSRSRSPTPDSGAVRGARNGPTWSNWARSALIFRSRACGPSAASLRNQGRAGAGGRSAPGGLDSVRRVVRRRLRSDAGDQGTPGHGVPRLSRRCRAIWMPAPCL